MTRDSQGRWRQLAKYLVWIVVIPLVAIGLFAGLGALHGALEQDCQVGLFSACGPGAKALAYVVFVSVPAVIVYYLVLALVAVFRLIRPRSTVAGPPVGSTAAKRR
jgi:hypothetical protein